VRLLLERQLRARRLGHQDALAQLRRAPCRVTPVRGVRGKAKSPQEQRLYQRGRSNFAAYAEDQS